jgi:hypothetical protein
MSVLFTVFVLGLMLFGRQRNLPQVVNTREISAGFGVLICLDSETL